MKINADKVKLGIGDALMLIDIQKDFLAGGRLAVPEGDQIIPVTNAYIDHFISRQLPVFATRDWHPKGHHSFIGQGGTWPEHCVAGSIGAEFAGDLNLPTTVHIFSKGIGLEDGGYSDFANPEMDKWLVGHKVSRLFIGGLATDYCVLNTVCDALDLNYQVVLLTDAVRAINVHRQDGGDAINKMILKGAMPITLNRVE